MKTITMLLLFMGVFSPLLPLLGKSMDVSKREKIY